jgi:hypothetical protein
MSTKKLTCDNCGAALVVSGQPNFVDCRYCEASLRVVRTESATFTEVREQLDALDEQVSDLRKAGKLRQLDAEWHAKRLELTGGAYGFKSGPSRAGGVAIAVIFLVGSIACFAFPNPREQSYQASFGVFLLLVGFGTAGYIFRLADRYDRLEQEYLQRRASAEASED